MQHATLNHVAPPIRFIVLALIALTLGGCAVGRPDSVGQPAAPATVTPVRESTAPTVTIRPTDPLALTIARTVIAASATATPATPVPTDTAVATVEPTLAPSTAEPASVAVAASGLTMPAGLVSARVIHVVDGDTVDVLVDGSEERLRLIGIDTPETVHPSEPVGCFGREASAFAKELLSGQDVFLEADASQDNRDRYGRMLRYVWLADGRMFNYEVVAQGYGFEYTYNVPYTYQAQFRDAQLVARETQAGLWSPAACNGEQKPADDSTGSAPAAAPPAASASFSGCAANPGGAPNTPVTIMAVDKRAEVVTLKNVSSEPISLDGWTMCSIRGGQTHPIGGMLAPGEQRAYPNTGDNIWNNSQSDPGALYDAAGQLIAYWPD